LLEERFGVRQVSTGDMLRDAQHDGTPLGREARQYMQQGSLVPDEVVIGIVTERLAREDVAAGYILDGFPRTLAQARVFDALLAGAQQRLDAVVAIDVPEEELIARLAGRRVCRGCGAMFHVTFDPPRREGVCDRCGGVLFQREDDREAAIRRRLELYARETAPVAAHYGRQGLLRNTLGTGTRDEVFARVLASVAGNR
jgi:adenylate kinase